MNSLFPLCVLLACSGQTVAEPAGLSEAIVDQRMRSVAICPQTVCVLPQGRSVFGGTLGPQSGIISREVATALAERAKGRYRVADRATVESALRSVDIDNLRTAQKLRSLGEKLAVDGLVILTARERDSEYAITADLFDLRNQRPVRAVRYEKQKGLQTVAYAGQSFEIRRFSNGILRPYGLTMCGKAAFATDRTADVQQFSALEKDQKHPLTDSSFPFGLDVLVNGSPRKLYEIRGRLYAALDLGEEFTIGISNRLGKPVQMAIYVDGLNTIGKMFEEPEATPFQRSWIIHPTSGKQRIPISWLPIGKPQPSGTEIVETIKIVKQSESLAVGRAPEERFGTITAVIYTHGPVATDTTPQRGADGRLLTGADTGTATVTQMPRETGERGILLAAFTVNYRTKDEIDSLLKAPAPPSNSGSPVPNPPDETTTTTTVPNTSTIPGETIVATAIASPPPSTANSPSETQTTTPTQVAQSTPETQLATADKRRQISAILASGKSDSAVGVSKGTDSPAPATAGDVLARNLQITNDGLFSFERVKKQLQIAFVIDGTDSMGIELDSLSKNLRNFATGLKTKIGPDCTISMGIIVYRDTEAPSGPIKLQSGFTSDLVELQKQFDSIKPETGAPFYEELVDQGVQLALSKLEWMPRNKDGEVTRWLILCGDAPPYPEGHKFRKYSTEVLDKLAKERGVEVYSFLVNSGTVGSKLNSEQLLVAAKKMRPITEKFMATMSTETGGQFLNFWNEDAVLSALKPKLRFSQSLQRITSQEVAAFQQREKVKGASVSVAVLPHSKSFNSISFDPKKPETQVATLMREKLRMLPGIVVRGPKEVEDAVAATLQDKPATDKDFVKELAREADVDFAIWGDYSEDSGKASATSRMYKRLDGAIIAEAKQSTGMGDRDGMLDLVAYTADALRKNVATELEKQGEAQDVVAVFSSPSRDAGLKKQLVARLASDIRAQRSILAGLDQLEKALAYLKAGSSSSDPGSGAGVKLLEAARAELETAVGLEPKNAYAHLLLASCYFNLSPAPQPSSGSSGIPPDVQKELELAYQNRTDKLFANGPVADEIEAEYALLVKKDISAAVDRYQAIINRQQQHEGKARFVLRAQWMLAGIALGDWGVKEASPKHVDLDKARLHILTILAGWPDSPEAAFYKKCMSDGTGNQMTVPVGGPQALASN